MRLARVEKTLVTLVLAIGMIAATPLVGSALDPGGSFGDDNDSIHEPAIEAIAADGITRGCNPPVNDLFCPSASVTREQMASFLVRALDLPAGTAAFTDLADSVHASDIAALATAGITKGCNPPSNNMFCPAATVTREQMASFLARALDLPNGTALFTDTAGSIHASDISALATAGITKGCNPPDNDRFCPRDPVTREQMASFLARALGLVLVDPPPPLPDPSPDPLVVYGIQNWLFFNETVDQDCLDPALFARATAELGKAKQIVEMSGRGFVYTVPPNKAVIHNEYVAPGSWTGSCAAINSVALASALSSAADPNRVDLAAPFARATDQLYFKHDTHWNATGALLGSELISAKAAPGVWDGLTIIGTPASRQGDLADIIGVEWVVEYEELTPTLTGVVPTVTVESATISGRPLVTYRSPGTAALSPTKTAVIHDSFGLFFRNKLGPLFEDATFVPNFSHPISDDARGFVTASEQIVLEVVERNLLRDLIGAGAAGHLAAALADDFVQSPVPSVQVGDELEFTLPAGAPGDLRYLIVTADVASTAVIGSLSDFSASDAAWPNEITPEASRYGFEIVDSPATLRLPLPPSVNVTSAVVVVIE